MQEIIEKDMRLEAIEQCAKELVELRNGFESKFPDLNNMEVFDGHLLTK